MPTSVPTPLPAVLQWTGRGRCLVFVLAATSIWCLLSEMYGLIDMRTFFFAILLPCTAALYGMAWLDHARGDGRLARAVVIGSAAGLVGAVAYDVFRLPFVFADAWGLSRLGVPQMPLFKVFPRFGAMILGQAMEQGVPMGQPGSAWGRGYSTTAHVVGWAYHLSNGATFGVMFAAMYAGARDMVAAARRSVWRPVLWAVLMAVGIEVCLLISPYTSFFGIRPTARFVAVTIAAHVVFGVGLGLWYARQVRRWRAVPRADIAS